MRQYPETAMECNQLLDTPYTLSSHALVWAWALSAFNAHSLPTDTAIVFKTIRFCVFPQQYPVSYFCERQNCASYLLSPSRTNQASRACTKRYLLRQFLQHFSVDISNYTEYRILVGTDPFCGQKAIKFY